MPPSNDCAENLRRDMARKKTDNCCRYCKHRGWGRTNTRQTCDKIVCLLKPKEYVNDIVNIEPHYYATRLIDWCENFERRDEK